MSVVTIVHSHSGLRIGTARNLLFAAWLEAPTIENLRAFRMAARTIARRYPRGTVGSNLILSGTPTFSDGVRQEIIAMSRELELFPLGFLHLIEIGGFAGAATRAFLSAMVLAGRPRNPTKVMSDVDEGVRWLASLLEKGPAPWTVSAISEAHAEMIRVARERGSML